MLFLIHYLFQVTQSLDQTLLKLHQGGREGGGREEEIKGGREGREGEEERGRERGMDGHSIQSCNCSYMTL